MTVIEQPSTEPLVLTTTDRQRMKQQLERDAGMIIELAERIGRDDLGASNLVDDDADDSRLDPIAGRVLRRRLLRAVLRHTRRAARLAELLLELPREPVPPQVWREHMAGSAMPCSPTVDRRR